MVSRKEGDPELICVIFGFLAVVRVRVRVLSERKGHLIP